MHVQLFCCFFILILFIWIRKRTKKMQVFLQMGIPGPEPNVFFGNFLEIYFKGPIVSLSEWVRKYGKVLGFYHGTKPVLLVTDTELLKNIQIKDFQKFTDRPALFFQEVASDDISKKDLVSLKGADWKTLRSLITPTFTTRKMKLMSPIMKGAIDVLIEKIESKCQSGEIFDAYEFYRGLTMDVIGRTAFGIDTNVQKNPKDPLMKWANFLVREPFTDFVVLMTSSFPILNPLFRAVRIIIGIIENQFSNPLEEFTKRSVGVIKARMQDRSQRRVDLLQLMIDAEVKGSGKVNDVELIAGEDAETNEELKEAGKDSPGDSVKRLTIDEVTANTILFIVAGYETTSTALAFCTMVLANFPEVQEKIRKEIDEIFEKEGKIDYGSVQKMQYLDSVFSETLRLYPPVNLFVNREAKEDVDYGKIRIRKGMSILVPLYLLHRDPDYWPEPEKFMPERFAPENRSKNNPLAWQPFGAGPRNCVGMRFAQMESKLALAEILRKYHIERCHRTDTLPLDLDISSIFLSPKHGVPIRITRRDAA